MQIPRLTPALAIAFALLAPFVAQNALAREPATRVDNASRATHDYEDDLNTIATRFFSDLMIKGLLEGAHKEGNGFDQTFVDDIELLAKAPSTRDRVAAAVLPELRKTFTPEGARQFSTLLRSSAGQKLIATVIATLDQDKGQRRPKIAPFTPEEKQDLIAFDKSIGAIQLGTMNKRVADPSFNGPLQKLVFDLIGISPDFFATALPNLLSMVETGTVPAGMPRDAIMGPMLDRMPRTAAINTRFASAVGGADLSGLIDATNLVSQEKILDSRQKMELFKEETTLFRNDLSDVANEVLAHYRQHPGTGIAERFLVRKLSAGMTAGLDRGNKTADAALRFADIINKINDLAEANLGHSWVENDRLVFESPESARKYKALMVELGTEARTILSLFESQNDSLRDARKALQRVNKQMNGE